MRELIVQGGGRGGKRGGTLRLEHRSRSRRPQPRRIPCLRADMPDREDGGDEEGGDEGAREGGLEEALAPEAPLLRRVLQARGRLEVARAEHLWWWRRVNELSTRS